MNKRTMGATLAGALLVAGVAGGAVAVADNGNGNQDGSVTGPAADTAIAAALTETNGVKANAVERDTENGAVWEVEVTKADGSTVDVRLGGDYHVIVVEPDSEAGTQ